MLIGLAVVLGEPVDSNYPDPEPTRTETPPLPRIVPQGMAPQRDVTDAARASRSHERKAPLTPAPTQTQQAGSATGLPAGLLLIRHHESRGDYTAYNPTGCEGYGCGGAYQLHAKYAATWAAEAGFDGMSSQAQDWPPATQDAVALYKYNATDGRLWCDWTDYC
jgi:hypothetical protein